MTTEVQYTLNTETGHIAAIIDADRVKADDEYVMHTYGRLPVTFVRGAGVNLWDADGKQYLDFLGGIAVNGLGHCHPRVVRAIQEQAETLIHTSNLYYTSPMTKLAKKLSEISDFDRTFFCNSGAEANEAALKIARKFGKATSEDKFEVVTAQKSFHGRTLGSLTATGQPKYQSSFAPLLPGFDYVPYNDIEALADAVTDQTCAVMLEPVLGESGIYPATQAYLDAARKICDDHGALLIFDEVQTGVGRSGKWWAYQHYGVIPDVMTLAKALGGGVPIGACLARGKAAATLVPGDHGSTFGGNLLATAAALAVLQTIEDDHLLANAHAMGAYFVHRLNEEPFLDKVAEVRSLGLLVGVELTKQDAKRVQTEALDRGLILNAIGDTTLRFLPPLIITKENVDQAISILAEVI
jgi:predicted acetylornithine/succinylornithine family transaminase